jgi:hypothetical protein
MSPRIGDGNRQSGDRGLGGLPASGSPWLHRLGGARACDALAIAARPPGIFATIISPS